MGEAVGKVPVIVSGLSRDKAGRAEGAIAGVLGNLTGGDRLQVVAQRLIGGEWLLFVCDDSRMEVIDPGLTRTLLAALKIIDSD